MRFGQSTNLRGIGFMLAAAFIFSIMDSLMKRLSANYPPLEIACLRCFASFVFLSTVVAWRGSWSSLRVSAPSAHALRAILGIVMLWSFVYAVHRLTLAQTYSLFMAAPLMMTALSVPLLKERVTRRRWLAIAVGMGGVLLILKPWSSSTFSMLAAGAAALAAVSYSLSALTIRAMGARDSSTSMVFWYLGMVGVGSGALALAGWRTIELRDYAVLAGIGITGGFGQLWITEAFRRAPPSVVSPFEYTAILWAFAIDWTFWSATPSVNLLIGASIVIASGVFVLIDEQRLVAQTAVIGESPPP